MGKGNLTLPANELRPLQSLEEVRLTVSFMSFFPHESSGDANEST